MSTRVLYQVTGTAGVLRFPIPMRGNEVQVFAVMSARQALAVSDPHEG